MKIKDYSLNKGSVVVSFQEEKREFIKRYLFEKVRQKDTEFIQKTMENFDISITTVKRYLKDGLESGVLQESEDEKIGYELKSYIYTFSYDLNNSLNEDEIYLNDIENLLHNISNESKAIWYYAFTEMMNNAIEHSNCKTIQCIVKKDYLYTEISIIDDGIGIYKKIQSFLEQRQKKTVSYLDVLTELYKGKMTTDSSNHSGEGIFFTSKVLNEFAIWSEDTIYARGCYQKDQFVQSHLINYYNKLHNIGTMVVMKLENQTKRTIKEVFDMFAPLEEGFVKTRIPIKEVCPFAQPIARSQARRILYRLEEFKQVEFDFEGVEFMGQGFADEVFRVFQNKHPEIQLIPINACQTVLGMIKHVQKNLVKELFTF